jgi:hypothetical protein
MQVSDDRFQADSGWNAVSAWLCLEAVTRNLHETYQCLMYSRKLWLWAEKMPETCRVL